MPRRQKTKQEVQAMEALLAVHLSTKKSLRVANLLLLDGSYSAILFLNIHIDKRHMQAYTSRPTLIRKQTTDSRFFLAFLLSSPYRYRLDG
jgi:hypothetical protein